jgi:hypothetical protein
LSYIDSDETVQFALENLLKETQYEVLVSKSSAHGLGLQLRVGGAGMCVDERDVRMNDE